MLGRQCAVSWLSLIGASKVCSLPYCVETGTRTGIYMQTTLVLHALLHIHSHGVQFTEQEKAWQLEHKLCAHQGYLKRASLEFVDATIFLHL